MGAGPVPDLGRPAHPLPGGAHRSLRRCVAAGAPRRRRRGRLRHRAFHVALGGGEQRAARDRTTFPRRSASRRPSPPTHRSTRSPGACFSLRSAPRRSPATKPSPVSCAASSSTVSPDRPRCDAADRLRGAHPAARHREDARVPAGGRRHLPAVHSHDPRRGQHLRGGAPGAHQFRCARRVYRRPHRGAPRRAA